MTHITTLASTMQKGRKAVLKHHMYEASTVNQTLSWKKSILWLKSLDSIYYWYSKLKSSSRVKSIKYITSNKAGIHEYGLAFPLYWNHHIFQYQFLMAFCTNQHNHCTRNITYSCLHNLKSNYNSCF